IKKKDFQKSLKVMNRVFKKNLALCNRVIIFKKGEIAKGLSVPVGSIGIGTVCSVVINGIFVKSGIPVIPKFGSILQLVDYKPVRFTDLISYEGSSLDPLEVFIKSNMTSIGQTIKTGRGKILASMREVPDVSINHANQIIMKIRDYGFKGLIEIGRPGQTMFEVPVGIGKAGVVVAGGLNPLAALSEAGIEVNNYAM
ncbi:MAG: DUF128 domain-containing protein, partial [Actinomycetia bacterium]|nr:DUF128 domain-containing protein [Actinomycetes bacterium]